MTWACPKCKSTNLRVVVETWATLHQDDDNIETDTDDSLGLAREWDENSPMECVDCGHSEISKEFQAKKPRITLRRDTEGHCWMADFGSDSEVNTAFGTGIIPTAFTDRAKPETVLAAIQKLNPQCDVVLA